MTMQEILTIEEVAQLLRVSERTVYDWVQKGDIPGGKLGMAWRFKRSEIMKWIDQRLGAGKMPVSASRIPLSAVLTPERVVLLDSKLKEDALTTLVDVLASAPEIHDKRELMEQILRREELMSTGIGFGIGVPHVRLNSVDDLVMAVGVCRRPIIDYESLDGEAVRIICMIAGRADQHGKHIKTLAAISRKLRDGPLRERLVSASKAAEVYAILTEDED